MRPEPTTGEARAWLLALVGLLTFLLPTNGHLAVLVYLVRAAAAVTVGYVPLQAVIRASGEAPLDALFPEINRRPAGSPLLALSLPFRPSWWGAVLDAAFS